MPHYTGGGSYGGGAHFPTGTAPTGSSGTQQNQAAQNQTRQSVGSSGLITRRPIPGAARYRYMTVGGRAVNYYVVGAPKTRPAFYTVLFAVMLVFLIVLFTVAGIDEGLFIPEPLNLASYASGVTLADETCLLDTDVIGQAMEELLDTTGVSPALEIVCGDMNSKTLKARALSDYRRLFRDECHWLVVLQVPSDFDPAAPAGWSWEGVIGDRCGSAISPELEKKFTRTFQRTLKYADGPIESRLAAAYSGFAKKAGRIQVGILPAMTCALFLPLFFLGLWVLLRDCVQESRLKRAELLTPAYDPEDPAATVTAQLPSDRKTVVCEFCGTRYARGSVIRCPGCGAVPPRE